MKKQTAVGWLEMQVLRSRQLGFISNEKFNELLEQAKEMEENRIKEAVMDTFKNSEGYEWGMTAEEYYNEIFKSK